MNKKFKDVNVGDKLYFVLSNPEGISLAESRVEDIKFNGRENIHFINDFCLLEVSIDDFINSSSKCIKTFSTFIGVFIEQKTADDCYTSLIKPFNKSKSEKTIDDNFLYTKDELDNMSFDNMMSALKEMSLDEMLYHAAEVLLPVLNKNKKDKVADMNDEGKDCSDNLEEENSNDTYYVPSYDEIREMEIPSNMNKTGGLKSEKALLVITVNEDGIYGLDENHFDGVNPLYHGPKYYFHTIEVPVFDANADENAVDEVYRAIEKWIYEAYPEFEHLSYGEDWEYNILRGQDYSVDNKEINFNVFE